LNVVPAHTVIFVLSYLVQNNYTRFLMPSYFSTTLYTFARMDVWSKPYFR